MFGLNNPSLLRQQCYIDGAWCGADDGGSFAVRDPASGELLGHVPTMGAGETRRAIAAADAAWSNWKRTPAKSRAAILRRWSDLMLENADDLALILTREQGKPLAEARGEIAYGGVVHRVVRRRGASASTATPFRATSADSASS